MNSLVRPLNVAQFADYVQVKPKTVYKWISQNRCPQITRIGREIRFQPEHIQQWLDAQSEEQVSA
ncbi:Helix-turn-helix domain protein [Corynebacterium kalinowskii]|uniref:Helix-turn-helix domain protein n=1 Tax=Corynebacterium kalinowskii TaxID=2675216 RepID=A0A6B8VBT4_9CORY|nr:helix-turn-helix domain-containing protein [Corynebacterium kalinowskii]QGU01623.1 Helix-turn-helix domain protein [Corynebacterium kalinowskii]